ncbi:MAG: hypothetical protein OXC60_13255 [Litoreibacter sp.]|nr:hypothetical protein [Litoreibacter sp.]
MYAGIAGGLLVFTGLWHATEWLMDGRRRDTLMLIPAGLMYLLLGYLLVTVTGGAATVIAPIILPALGGTFAYMNLGKMDVRRWVTWTFIAVDVIIVLVLLIVLFS